MLIPSSAQPGDPTYPTCPPALVALLTQPALFALGPIAALEHPDLLVITIIASSFVCRTGAFPQPSLKNGVMTYSAHVRAVTAALAGC